ncbi:MAG: hypothetical protein M3P44_00630 [Actinomycetota bacterium]|nr:hypothetical protein [Actinomycetota bacterium]
MSPASTIIIRRAVTGDIAGLARLAALDSARPLAGEVLLAEHDGQTRAALSLRDGRTIADPFLPTAADVALLRTRAALMHGSGRVPSQRRGLRARLRAARA